MSIQKQEYELSIWYETLDENGIVSETKDLIIAAHDMNYLGAAKNLILQTKLNGTHELSFEMPDRFFDSAMGDYVHNEFVDRIFNESKLKLYYRGNWYEFVIKSVSDTKHFKSYMKKYTCTDSFIEELSRNGYGITFDTELHNNVDEIGILSREILEDSVWQYCPEHNWGDFTEYTEEKLLKVPLRMFNEIEGVKLNFALAATEQIENVFTHERRQIELGDDLASADIEHGREGYFWDDKNHNNPLMKQTLHDENIANDGYIYIPYSQIQFCYKTTSTEGAITATEEPQYFEENGKKLSYAIAPRTVDPTALIEFLAFPKDAKIEIDEAGLIVSKEFTYVMTVEQWNKNVKSNYYYKFLPEKSSKTFSKLTKDITFEELACGNKAIGYEGYLNKIGETEVMYGKKISIADRTEPNVTEEIDQFVTVYNNKSEDFTNLYENHETWQGNDEGYRVCSKNDTRQIVPQLARNLFQNGTQIKSTDGWEPQKTYISTKGEGTEPIAIKYYAPAVETSTTLSDDQIDNLTETNLEGQIIIDMSGAIKDANGQRQLAWTENSAVDDAYYTILNFGAIGQEEELSNTQIYCFGLSVAAVTKTIEGTRTLYSISTNKDDMNLNNMSLILGEGGAEAGSANGAGSYTINDIVEFTFSDSAANSSSNDGYKTFYFLFKLNKKIKHPYLAIRNKITLENNATQIFAISSCRLFKAYTKGTDFFEDAEYRYSGRDLFANNLLTISSAAAQQSKIYNYAEISKMVLLETDIMAGDSYSYRRYFIQQGIAGGEVYSTFGKRELLGITDKAIFDSEKYSEEDCEVNTKYIDLTNCNYYCSNSSSSFDCNYGNGEHICLYQKYGYCPYLFTTEKHCRKVRTLTGEKSNRFNLTQELSKVFEMYPIYYISHDSRGKTETQQIDDNTVMKKQLFYIKEKGVENKLGFRYEKNLSSISRDIKSDSIVTKLYVSDVDSELSKTGLCSIKTAEDNVSKDNFIINLDYYIKKGLLNKDMVYADLYGTDDTGSGYLQRLGHLNDEYDKLSDAIINLQNASTTELEANLEVNLNGIDSAKKNITRLRKEKSSYFARVDEAELTENSAYISYCTKINELQGTLRGLIFDTFISEENGKYKTFGVLYSSKTEAINAALQELNTNLTSAAIIKDSEYYKKHTYKSGMLGQFNAEMLQIAEWKKQRAAYLKQINKLSLNFFHKYEPYLKEGTWSDNNYVTDNAYYFGALEVAKKGSIPKVEYNISVVDLYDLPGYEDYKFDIADTTYVEDVGMFGINEITGFPRRLKVLVSGITYHLDEPRNNSITVQNFTTQFEDLFQQVTASVQSLSFNENIYMRASSFAANKTIKNESLQGALDTNELTLLKTEEKNIEIDKTGTSGSDINNHNNKYKLTGEGLFFSNNGGETWNVGVGASGINADYIKTGTLDAGKVRIVDGDYAYFLWDKEGIFAYRGVTSNGIAMNDYALFNRYGLSLVEQGQIRLRSGYSFSGSDGRINSESTLGNEVGFYLYDNNGHTVFATQVDSEGKNQSASLLLKGEMLVTNTFDNATTSTAIFEYSNQYNLQPALVPNIRAVRTKVTIESALKELVSSDGTYNSQNELQELLSEYWTYYENEDSFSCVLQYPSNYVIVEATNLNNPSTDAATVKMGNSILSYFSRYTSNSIVHLYISSTSSIEESTAERQENFILSKFKDNLNNGWYRQINTYQLYRLISQSSTKYGAQELVRLTSLEYYVPSDPSASTPSQIQRKNFYRVGQYYYDTVAVKSIDSQPQNGAVALYLNNKSDLVSGQGADSANRLLSCVVDYNSEVFNIFTIQKSGILYMGGTITDVTDVSEVPDKVSINSPLIEIDSHQGSLKMKFSNLKDLDTGENLIDYVQGEMAKIALIRHNHQINSDFKATFSGGKGIHWLTSSEKQKFYNKMQSITDAQTLATYFSFFIQMLDGLKVTELSDPAPKLNIPLFDTAATIHLSGATEYTGGVSPGGNTTMEYALLDPAD